uniref:Uncharacterized protein n=1 Tax=Fagus sylvatica TaxID=28930 RepID=A0A2N9EXQ7_FAGSY
MEMKNGEVEVRKVLHFGSLNNIMMSVFGKSYEFGSGSGGKDGSELDGLVVESGGKNIEIDVMMIEHGLLQLEEAEIDAIV